MLLILADWGPLAKTARWLADKVHLLHREHADHFLAAAVDAIAGQNPSAVQERQMGERGPSALAAGSLAEIRLDAEPNHVYDLHGEWGAGHAASPPLGIDCF